MAEYIEKELVLSKSQQDYLEGRYDYDDFVLVSDIESIPPAAVRPVKSGRWIPHPDPNCKEWDVCTACGTGCKRREYGIYPDGTDYVIEENYPYCPHCGAKIRDGDAE